VPSRINNFSNLEAVIEDTNIALNCLATANSFYNEGGQYSPPAHLVNGIHNGSEDWTANGTGIGSWVQLDFGRVYTISGYTVFLAEYGLGSNPVRNLKTWHVDRYDTTSSTWIQVDAVANNTGGQVHRELASFRTQLLRLTVGDPVADQYPQYPVIAEWEVYGH
jgi:hypothetical protein